MARSARLGSAALVLGVLALGAMGCAPGPEKGAASQPARTEAASKPVEPPRGVPPPPSSKLSKVQLGWNDEQVRAAVGAPDHVEGYITGKSFIPFYFGTDTSRTDWEYKGEGRVVFSRNAYSGTLKVVRIDYDPNEVAD